MLNTIIDKFASGEQLTDAERDILLRFIRQSTLDNQVLREQLTEVHDKHYAHRNKLIQAITQVKAETTWQFVKRAGKHKPDCACYLCESIKG